MNSFNAPTSLQTLLMWSRHFGFAWSLCSS